MQYSEVLRAIASGNANASLILGGYKYNAS